MLQNFKKTKGEPALFEVFQKNENGVFEWKDYQSEHIIAGDSVTGDTQVITQQDGYIPIQDLFDHVDVSQEDGKEYYFPSDQYVLTYDEQEKRSCFRKVNYVMRHRCEKNIVRTYTTNKIYIDTTEDHSLMNFNRKNNKLKESTPYQTTEVFRYLSKDIVVTQNIEKIQPLGIIDDYVYDIEVDDTHMFFANDILVHNTDSSMASFEQLFDNDTPKETVVEKADEIVEKVNSHFPDFMKAVCNVDNPMVNTEREIVADKAYFKGKKNYMMHVVDQEGKEKDEYKIKGLEIIRTDTAPIVQEYLKELVIALMNDASYREVKSMIKRFKEDYYTRTIQEIARPMSIKVLTKYEQMYKVEGSMHGFSYHVRASLFYNSLCGPNDIKIRSGDKIGICYIKHPDSKYIAVPRDADVLPSSIDQLEIDWEAQWKTVEKKLQTYLEAVGWDRNGTHQQVVTQRFQFG